MRLVFGMLLVKQVSSVCKIMNFYKILTLECFFLKKKTFQRIPPPFLFISPICLGTEIKDVTGHREDRGKCQA